MVHLKHKPPQTASLEIIAIAKGLLICLTSSLFLSILLGLILHFSNLTEDYLSLFASIIILISTFLGGAFTAKQTEKHGFLYGIGVGCLFFLTSWLLAVLFLPGQIIYISALYKSLLFISAGGLGGMVGVVLSS